MTVYGSLKLRTYILIGLDKVGVQSALIFFFAVLHCLCSYLFQDEVEGTFYIVTFAIQFAAYLCQLPLSLIPEPKPKGTHAVQREVRDQLS